MLVKVELSHSIAIFEVEPSSRPTAAHLPTPPTPPESGATALAEEE